MFLKLKTRFYFIARKKKIILLVFFLIVIIFALTLFFVLKEDKPKTGPVTKNTIDKTSVVKPEKTNSIIYGVDIKNKYNEVKGTDFAILVTTTKLLEGLENNNNKDNNIYILNNNDTNTVSEIKDTDGNYMDAVVVNYNRRLNDTTITKDISGGYITPYGFANNGEKKFNKYVNKKSLEINDNSEFSETPIYDSNYNEIGIVYIEINENTIADLH